MLSLCRANSLLIALLIAIQAQAAPATTEPATPTTHPTVANATTQPAKEAQISGWFADLANRDSTRRDAARQNLMGLSRDDLPILQAIVKKNHPLAPSQTAALRDIVTQVFLAGESYTAIPQRTGFLGVSYQGFIPGAADDTDADNPHTGVVVIERIPGFAGNRFLQNGDVIMGATEMGDQVINRREDLQGFINQYHDGDTVHLRILRSGQTITIPVQLGARPAWTESQHAFGNEQLQQMDELRQRQGRANDYWDNNFAQLIDDSVS